MSDQTNMIRKEPESADTKVPPSNGKKKEVDYKLIMGYSFVSTWVFLHKHIINFYVYFIHSDSMSASFYINHPI